MSGASDQSLYVREGRRFVPGELTRGPWSPDAQHGGPPSALLAFVAERFEAGDGTGHQIARVTVELLRPVPLAPLDVDASWLRPGRKVQLVGVSMRSDGVEVARASVLRIRREKVDLPRSLPATERLAADAPAAPEKGQSNVPPWAGALTEPAYHSHAVEHRFVRGGFDVAGPARDWIRLRMPLVAGEATSGVCRAVAAADFGNGVSWELSRTEGYRFINPDLTVYLHRQPVGEWICLDAATYPSPDGAGLAESLLHDESGPVGRSLQSLLLEKH